MNKQIIDVIKSTKSVSELKDLAVKNGFNLTDEKVESYFSIFHKNGNISDSELENVAGGICNNGRHYSSDSNNYLIVTIGNSCDGQVDNPGYFGAPGTCLKCTYVLNKGAIHYCTMRSLTDDPYNEKIGTSKVKLANGRYW